MSLLHMLCMLVSVTLSESRATREAYYTRQTTAETGAGLKTLECGIKYLREEFGAFKTSEDGMECTTEPWSWFDTTRKYLHNIL